MDDEDNVTFPNGIYLSRKVVAVAAGEAHTLALAADGSVYSWGRGMFGRLGTGVESDEHFPVPVKFEVEPEKKLKFVGVAAGCYHSLALADDGSVWCWGYNIYGQLGVNGGNSLVPCLLEQFIELDSATSNVPLQICSVKAGGMMSVAIDNLGTLWMWGNCPQESSSSEGGFSLVSSFTPTPVWDFHGHTVANVACGTEHVVALVSAGEYKGDDLVCFSWGSNSHGQLGLGDTENRNRPEIVGCFNQDSHFTVYEIACGAFHTALLTTRKGSERLESMCWTFGLGENGQLGHGTTQSVLSPKSVKELPQSIYLISVDCGLFHTSAVSSAGDVWSWGMENGLGLCPDVNFTGTDARDALSPLQIVLNGSMRSKFEEPVQVVCGAAHTLLVANDGYKLWSWGRGRSGVLGNGKTIDCLSPTVVLWPPLADDFMPEEQNADDDDDDAADTGVTETENFSKAIEETKLLESKLKVIERYAGILHDSIFGEPLEEQDIPIALQKSSSYDIAKEWDGVLESADRAKLLRVERFYQNMLEGVKNKLMKRRVQEIVKECLSSSPINKP